MSNIPAYELTWDTTQTNIAAALGANVTATHQTVIYNWLTAWLATSSPPTVKGSSDSTTAGMDGVNRISAANKVVWVGAAVVHSWIVLEFPNINDGAGGKLQICLDFKTAQGGGDAWDWTLVSSKSAGFTGGTTSARPTATDEKSTGDIGFLGNTNVAFRIHVIASTDGTVYHSFFCEGGGTVAWLMVAKPTTLVAGWDYPYYVHFEGNALNGATSATHVTPTEVTTYSATRHMARHGATDMTASLQMEGGAATLNAGGAGAAAHGISNDFPCLPAPIWSNAGVVGRMGRIKDLYFTSVTGFAGAGDDFGPDASHRKFAIFGSAVVPWRNDATAPLGA